MIKSTQCFDDSLRHEFEKAEARESDEEFEFTQEYLQEPHYETNNSLDKEKIPDCPRCGNNRQVWINQITGTLTCHRAFCHTEIKPEKL